MASRGTWSSIANGGQSSITAFYYSDLVLAPGDPNDGKHCTCNQGSIVNPGCETDCPSDKETLGGCGFLFFWSCNGYMPVL